jgi:phosphoribosylglycinamide formyltransferase-1
MLLPNTIIILASGNGTNAQAIIKHFNTVGLNADFIIASNKPNAGVLVWAKQNNITHFTLPQSMWTADTNNTEFADWLKLHNANWVVLAGFLKKIPQNTTVAFDKKIINIHPSLLPLFGGKGMYGHYVHEAVINAKAAHSGLSIHYVNAHYDTGAIIFQVSVALSANETAVTLAAKVLEQEHYYYPRVLVTLIAE